MNWDPWYMRLNLRTARKRALFEYVFIYSYLRFGPQSTFVLSRPAFSLPTDSQPVSPPESLPSPDSRSGTAWSTFKVEVSRCFVKRVVSEKERKKKGDC